MYKLFFTLFSLCVSLPTVAADWQTTSFLVQHANTFKDSSSSNATTAKTIFTLEHASGWKYGSNFFFFDVTGPDTEKPSIYGEFSPSFSLGKIFKKDLSYSILRDISLTATYELPSGSTRSFLYGTSLHLNIPMFAFFDISALARDNVGIDGQTYQVSLAWALPFKIEDQNVLFEGFADFAGAEGSGANKLEANTISASRLLLDVGQYLDTPSTLYLGIEQQIWRNKFGVKNWNEDLSQATLKWNF